MADRGWLAIDVQGLQSVHFRERGIGRYVHQQVAGIVAEHASSIAALTLNPNLEIGNSVEPFLGLGIPIHRSLAPPPGDTLPEVYYATSPFELDVPLEEMWPQWARDPSVKTAVTAYDFIPLIYDNEYLRDPATHARYLARLHLIRHADLVLCISDATASDALELLQIDASRIVTIGTGVPAGFWEPDSTDKAFRQAVQRLPRLRRGFIFYTGGVDFRKNIGGLLQAYALVSPEVRQKHQLVITCHLHEEERRRLESEAAKLGIERDLLLTGYVPDSQLLSLYQATDLFVFPSLYEGFGLPLVEAAASGAISIASDSSSMKEIVTSPDLRFDPEDPEDLAGSMTRALTSPELRAAAESVRQEILSRFRWSDVAQRTFAVLESRRRPRKVPPPTRAKRRERPTLAILSPMPPQASGIAFYTDRLASALAEHIDVTVVVDGPSGYFEASSDDVSIVDIASFRILRELGAYDRVLYVMGNSEFHGHVYEELKNHPGPVLAHEARFTGFYSWYGSSRHLGPNWFYEKLHQLHPGAAPECGVDGWIDTEQAAYSGIFMSGELVDLATEILVHSRFTADIFRLQRPNAWDRIYPIPFGYPPPATHPRQKTQERLVATFGIQAPVKRTDLFVRAAAAALKQAPDLRFAIVGPIDGPYRGHILDLVKDFGIGSQVTLTGHQDVDEYERWLDRTLVAVQLRDTTNGEVSAAIGDTLRHGIPTLATDIGPNRELPADAVILMERHATEEQLASEICNLLENPDLRDRLTQAAGRFIGAHQMEQTARAVAEALGIAVTNRSAAGSS